MKFLKNKYFIISVRFILIVLASMSLVMNLIHFENRRAYLRIFLSAMIIIDSSIVLYKIYKQHKQNREPQ